MMKKKSNKLLILDLDETLIHATENKLAIKESFQFDKYFVYERPHLQQFLIDISAHFELGIWSTGDDDYVNEIVQHIKPDTIDFVMVWGRSKCSLKRDSTFDNYYYEKRLTKLKKKGFSLNQMIIVDDTPEKSGNNYGNAVYIKEYLGNTSDEELKHLYDYLLIIKDVENVRVIEKRDWRTT